MLRGALQSETATSARGREGKRGYRLLAITGEIVDTRRLAIFFSLDRLSCSIRSFRPSLRSRLSISRKSLLSSSANCRSISSFESSGPSDAYSSPRKIMPPTLPTATDLSSYISVTVAQSQRLFGGVSCEPRTQDLLSRGWRTRQAILGPVSANKAFANRRVLFPQLQPVQIYVVIGGSDRST